ncbi:hypothetical protein AC629_28305 [Bradyrhizobium sp. NAS80.1]|nr:hypothetical protein AC629_28305 [Bradyrhizobium sp. NAS80.1]
MDLAAVSPELSLAEKYVVWRGGLHVETYMDVAGIPLRLVRGGQGSRILFLHGAAGLQGWLPFFEALSASHEVVAT